MLIELYFAVTLSVFFRFTISSQTPSALSPGSVPLSVGPTAVKSPSLPSIAQPGSQPQGTVINVPAYPIAPTKPTKYSNPTFPPFVSNVGTTCPTLFKSKTSSPTASPSAVVVGESSLSPTHHSALSTSSPSHHAHTKGPRSDDIDYDDAETTLWPTTAISPTARPSNSQEIDSSTTGPTLNPAAQPSGEVDSSDVRVESSAPTNEPTLYPAEVPTTAVNNSETFSFDDEGADEGEKNGHLTAGIFALGLTVGIVAGVVGVLFTLTLVTVWWNKLYPSRKAKRNVLEAMENSPSEYFTSSVQGQNAASSYQQGETEPLVGR